MHNLLLEVAGARSAVHVTRFILATIFSLVICALVSFLDMWHGQCNTDTVWQCGFYSTRICLGPARESFVFLLIFIEKVRTKVNDKFFS